MSDSIRVIGSAMQASGGMDDITVGWYFSATMQLRTPNAILRRHLEFWPKKDGQPPSICPEGWEGIWMLALNDWRRITALQSMAADVGPVPADGGDYLPFLLALQDLANGDHNGAYGSMSELIEATGERGTPHVHYVERLGGIPGCVGLGLVRTIFLVVWRYDYAEQLWNAGFRTIQGLLSATDEELCTARAFSKSGLQTIRRAARRSSLPAFSEYV
jgi:hypothetical protein